MAGKWKEECAHAQSHGVCPWVAILADDLDSSIAGMQPRTGTKVALPLSSLEQVVTDSCIGKAHAEKKYVDWMTSQGLRTLIYGEVEESQLLRQVARVECPSDLCCEFQVLPCFCWLPS